MLGALTSILGGSRRRRGGFGLGRVARTGGMAGLVGNPIARMAIGGLAAYGARRWYNRRSSGGVQGQASTPAAVGGTPY